MFKMTSLPYLKAIGAIAGAASDRLFVGAAAVAATIVECLDLPTAPVSMPESYYAQHYGIVVRDQIGTFNEAATIDTIRALELARKLWLFRYNVLYGMSPYMGKENDFFFGYMQVDLLFSPDEIKLFNKYSVQISSLQNQIRLMIDPDRKRQPTPSVVKTDTAELREPTTSIIY